MSKYLHKNLIFRPV